MQFLVKAYDGDGMLEKRMEVRPRHLEGMKALGRQIICAGGLLDDEGRMKGSALVMEFPDRAALEEYLKNEPYVVEGVWQKIEVEPMNVVLVNGEKRALIGIYGGANGTEVVHGITAFICDQQRKAQ